MVKVKPNGVTVVDHGKSYYFPMNKISSVYVCNDSSRFLQIGGSILGILNAIAAITYSGGNNTTGWVAVEYATYGNSHTWLIRLFFALMAVYWFLVGFYLNRRPKLQINSNGTCFRMRGKVKVKDLSVQR